MSGSDLIEMYGEAEYMDGRSRRFRSCQPKGRMHGEDEAELMGRSFLRRRAAALKKVVKNPGRLLAYAAAPVTGGTSLLALKSTRKTIGSGARFTQKKILRPTAKFTQKAIVRPTGRVLAPLIKPVTKAGLNYVTGGASGALFDTGIFDRAKKQLAKAIPGKKEVDQGLDQTSEAAAPGGISKTVMIGAGIAVVAGLGLFLATRSKAGKSEK